MALMEKAAGQGHAYAMDILGRGLHTFPFQLNLSSAVHRITQLSS
jgi:hypothetical protein